MAKPRNILVVGAYERDNFGDYLFLEVAKRVFPDDNLIPGSVVYADLREIYGIQTIPYDFVLSKYKVDAVWVVGGEVGTVDILGAAKMSLPLEILDCLDESNQTYDQALVSIQESLGANSSNIYAYIPDLRIYKLNAKTPLIVNSIGLSFSGKDDQRMGLLKTINYLSVRDQKSKDWLNDSFDVSLYPDFVHFLPTVYKPRILENVGVVFQVNEQYVNDNTIDRLVDILVKIWQRFNQMITIIPAGIARGHDSMNQLNEIVIKLKHHNVNVRLVKSRKPLDIVDYIANSKLVIATSLHMRIVACAYGIPRVSLQNLKVANYAQTWDTDMPYDVSLIDVVNATGIAMSFDEEQLNLQSTKLQALVNQSIEKIRSYIETPEQHEVINIDHVISLYKQDLPNKLMLTIAATYKSLFSNIKNLNDKNTTILNLEQKILYQQNETRELATQLNNIKNSKAFKYVEKLRDIKHRITKH